MRKIKILLTILFVFLIVVSCKKEVANKGSNGVTALTEAGTQKGPNSNYEVGGTIGCVIRFTDKKDAKYGDNDAYDKCFYDQTHKDPSFPSSGHSGPLVPAEPERVPSIDRGYLMEYYWGLFDVLSPKTISDYNVVKSKLAIYNAVIVAVYTDAFGNLVIPSDRAVRRTMLENYSGVLPQKIIEYVDFVYGPYFALEISVASGLYSTLPDADGIIHTYTYGVKVLGVDVPLALN